MLVRWAGLRDSYVPVLSCYIIAVYNRIGRREYVLSDHQGQDWLALLDQEMKW